MKSSRPTRSDVGPRPLGCDLLAYADRIALITERGQISYGELARRVARAARKLGSGRRLVLIVGANDVEAVVAYLGALAAGHPVLLAPGDNPVAVETLTSTYDPDVVVRRVGRRWRYEQRRAGSAHVLHPDLALLLSTSGSTGSPKLVRLSHHNLRSNAEAIATYLDIRATDRAATTLPMHYCYGLSVINSHLVKGAGVILTDRSVADPSFWELFGRAEGTTFAGVPYTFTLLDRIRFETKRLPHLRYVTQAGGRLAPEQVRRYAGLGLEHGWDLYVMYGQTEATARMAYLPPSLAGAHPGAIGVPIPGGSLRLEPVDDIPGPDGGELVYTGANVMLGYAEQPADLALGRTVHELRTGDLARRTADGMYEIVGRRSRFAKVFGLRIDLERIEAGLEADGVTACCTVRDDQLIVVVQEGHHRGEIDRQVAARCGLPVHGVRLVMVSELPRLASGKPDHQAVGALGEATQPRDGATGTARGDASAPTALRAVYAEILDRPEVSDDDSFVSLGGDSLSYVEMSVRLEEMLGGLPAGWEAMPIRELTARPDPPPVRRLMIDTTVLLRAISIVLIVGSHIHAFTIHGGAHLLLAVAGFNFARFHLASGDRRERIRHIAATVARVAVPTSIFVAAVVVFTDYSYTWKNVALLTEAIGPRFGDERNLWFIETYVYILLALALMMAVPVIDRCVRRFPFAVPMTVLGLALTVRFGLIPVSPWHHMATPVQLLWLFALGWAAGKAGPEWQRWLVTAITVAAVANYDDERLQVVIVGVGVLLLVWAPKLPSSVMLRRFAGALAGASLSIYVTHWHVYPLLDGYSRYVALVASLVVGVLYGGVVRRLTARLPRLHRPAPERAVDSGSVAASL
ncbi:AMP-binding protein [Krasilnikovia sp. MM14-A1259]|uniref:AMP-binding protein n=1 Tax=Krasilnikovia sp. MM14-A1259 TaxID=3373539 RepID=UPI00381B1A95